MTQDTDQQTRSKQAGRSTKMKKPRKPMSRTARRVIAVAASILWGLLVTMLITDWLAFMYTAENMTTVMPSLVVLLSAVPLAIAAMTTKRLRLVLYMYQSLVLGVLTLIVFPIYIPSIILFGSIWLALIWVMRTPVLWGDYGQPTEK